MNEPAIETWMLSNHAGGPLVGIGMISVVQIRRNILHLLLGSAGLLLGRVGLLLGRGSLFLGQRQLILHGLQLPLHSVDLLLHLRIVGEGRSGYQEGRPQHRTSQQHTQSSFDDHLNPLTCANSLTLRKTYPMRVYFSGMTVR